MPLPIVQLPWDEFTFSDGQTTKYRGLSRAEALKIGMIDNDPIAIEAMAIAFATDTPHDETEKWLANTPQEDVRRLFDAIRSLSGLMEEAGKDSGEDLPLEKSTDLTTSSPKI